MIRAFFLYVPQLKYRSHRAKQRCRVDAHTCAAVFCSLQRKRVHKIQLPPPLYPSPRATRAESTKRHVENEGEERGGEEQEEEGKERMKERGDGHKRQPNLPRLILISC